MRKLKRKLSVLFILPIKWKFQKMKVVESMVYPTPKELLAQLDEVREQMPQAARSDKERHQFLLGQESVLTQLLYGKQDDTTEHNEQ